MSLLAYLDNAVPAERRGSPRKRVRFAAGGELASGARTLVTVHDLSRTGLLLEADVSLEPGERIDVELPGPCTARAIAVWTSGRFTGCQFDVPIPETSLEAAVVQEKTVQPAPDREKMSQVAAQVNELSMAVLRLTRILDRVLDQMGSRKPS